MRRFGKEIFGLTALLVSLSRCGGVGGSSGDADPPAMSDNQEESKYECIEGLKASLVGTGIKTWAYDLKPAKYCGTGRAVAIASDSAGNIFIGGRFNSIGTLDALNIAMYSTKTGKWSALGTGIEVKGSFGDIPMEKPVSGLAVSGTTLYVSGTFVKAGGVETENMAKYDIETGTWSAMPLCAPGRHGSQLVVDSAGNIYSGDGCKWDGKNWAQLLPKNYSYSPIAIKDDEVFTSINNQLQKFSLTTSSLSDYKNGILDWSGSGFEQHLSAIARGSGSDVYVSGTFTKVGGVDASNVAKWDGSTWTALGAGIAADDVKAITVHGSDVYFANRWDWGPREDSLFKWDGSKMTKVTLPGLLKGKIAPAAMLPVGDDLWMVGNDGVVVKTPFSQLRPVE